MLKNTGLGIVRELGQHPSHTGSEAAADEIELTSCYCIIFYFSIPKMFHVRHMRTSKYLIFFDEV